MESKRPLGIGAAIATGLLVVNGPVIVLLSVPAVAAMVFRRDDVAGWLLLPAFVAAWAWWSLAVPRWRLWAYERVGNIPELQRKAVAAGLVWRRGSFFERTEIKSASQRARQAEFERVYDDCRPSCAHGNRADAVVCCHLLGDKTAPAGFVENNSDPDDLQAWCDACEAKFMEEGEDMTEAFRAFNDMAIVCVDCYAGIKARHSIPGALR